LPGVHRILGFSVCEAVAGALALMHTGNALNLISGNVKDTTAVAD
jgi:hypothetical protein